MLRAPLRRLISKQRTSRQFPQRLAMRGRYTMELCCCCCPDSHRPSSLTYDCDNAWNCSSRSRICALGIYSRYSFFSFLPCPKHKPLSLTLWIRANQSMLLSGFTDNVKSSGALVSISRQKLCRSCSWPAAHPSTTSTTSIASSLSAVPCVAVLRSR